MKSSVSVKGPNARQFEPHERPFPNGRIELSYNGTTRTVRRGRIHRFPAIALSSLRTTSFVIEARSMHADRLVVRRAMRSERVGPQHVCQLLWATERDTVAGRNFVGDDVQALGYQSAREVWRKEVVFTAQHVFRRHVRPRVKRPRRTHLSLGLRAHFAHRFFGQHQHKV